MPAPPEILVFFAELTPPIQCHSVAEMDAELSRLHKESLQRQNASGDCPLTACVYIPGLEIYTGLGATESFVMIGAEPFDEWYTAVGDEKSDGDSKMFYGVGQDSYWAPKHLIPAAVARDAVRYFIEHQERSPRLQWES